MLVKYSYQKTDGKTVCGPYQCDDEDFKNFYRHLPLDVHAMIVEFEKSKCGFRVWIWQRATCRRNPNHWLGVKK